LSNLTASSVKLSPQGRTQLRESTRTNTGAHTSPLHQHRIPIPLLALPTLRFFPDSLPPFLLLLKRWSLTSNITPTPTSDSDSLPRLTYPTIFSHLSTTILTFLEAVEPNLRHTYTNIRFGFLTLPTLRFFPPLYLHFNFFLKRWSLTSNVTPTPTSDSDSPPRVTHPRIFSHLSTSILTFLKAVEPYLQRYPYTNIRFGFPSSPYLSYDFSPPLYHHLNFS